LIKTSFTRAKSINNNPWNIAADFHIEMSFSVGQISDMGSLALILIKIRKLA